MTTSEEAQLKSVFHNNFRNEFVLWLRNLYIRSYSGLGTREMYIYLRDFEFYQEMKTELERLKRASPPTRIKGLEAKSLLGVLGILKGFAGELFSHLSFSSEEQIKMLSEAIVPSAYQYNRGSEKQKKGADQIFVVANEISKSQRSLWYMNVNRLNVFIEDIAKLPIQQVLRLEKLE